MHSSYDNGDPTLSPGTGPYLPETNEVGVKQVLVLNANHAWWGTAVYGGPYLDRIEYIDYGSDPSAAVAAAESGEIDITYQTTGDFIEIYDGLGWGKSEAVTAATLAVRFNQSGAPYDNKAVRTALVKAVDNAVVLELGYNGLGTVAENHHVCPIHPEYAALPPLVVDPAAAKAEFDANRHHRRDRADLAGRCLAGGHLCGRGRANPRRGVSPSSIPCCPARPSGTTG